MNTARNWVLGLLGAMVSSAAHAVTVLVVDPDDFNPFAGGTWARLAAVVVVSAVTGAALFLYQQPLPWDGTDRRVRARRSPRRAKGIPADMMSDVAGNWHTRED